MSTYQEERFPLPTPRRLMRELSLERPPIWLLLILGVVFLAGWWPLAWAFNRRSHTSTEPRIHLIQDMDVQPSFGPQEANPLFADGRAMRLPVEGTVARGEFAENEMVSQGWRSLAPDGGTSAVEFCAEIPAELGDPAALVDRGRTVFGIYCATCHGADGSGDSIVHRRALARNEPQWVAPVDLRTDEIRARPAGHLYQTIRSGIRSMPGYGAQIEERDRWAVVAYILRSRGDAP